MRLAEVQASHGIFLGILSHASCSEIMFLHAQAFKGIKSLITSTIFNALGPKGINPLWPGIGYAGPDPERPLAPSQERLKAEAVLQQAMLDLGGTPCKTPGELLELLRHAGKAQAGSCLEVSCFLP